MHHDHTAGGQLLRIVRADAIGHGNTLEQSVPGIEVVAHVEAVGGKGVVGHDATTVTPMYSSIVHAAPVTRNGPCVVQPPTVVPALTLLASYRLRMECPLSVAPESCPCR